MARPLRPRLQEQAPHPDRAAEDGVEPVEYLIPKGKPFHLQDGDYIEKGDYILDGNPAPHDILAIKGVEALATYLVNEIQEVYRLQGVRSTTSTSR
jgi:DNA-directed RNA polymerase subunit beta'